MSSYSTVFHHFLTPLLSSIYWDKKKKMQNWKLSIKSSKSSDGNVKNVLRKLNTRKNATCVFVFENVKNFQDKIEHSVN